MMGNNDCFPFYEHESYPISGATFEESILVLYLFKSYLSIYLCITVLGLCCNKGFSLVAASRGYCLVTVCGLITAVAFLVAEHWL